MFYEIIKFIFHVCFSFTIHVFTGLGLCKIFMYLIKSLTGIFDIVLFQLPGRKSSGPGGWAIQGKLHIYLWLGLMKQKKNLLPGIPKGYELTYELRNIERSLTLPPITLHYTQKQVKCNEKMDHTQILPLYRYLRLGKVKLG